MNPLMKTLTNKIIEAANQLIKQGCKLTYSGNWVFDINDIFKATQWTEEELINNLEYLVDEISSREEVLDCCSEGINLNDLCIDVMFGIYWCPNYESCCPYEYEDGYDYEQELVEAAGTKAVYEKPLLEMNKL